MKSATALQHRCVTLSLGDPRLGGILTGLEIKDGVVIPNPKMFPCCQGGGSYFDAATQSVVACRLKTRIRRVQELLDQYNLLWGGKKSASPFKLTARASLDILGSVHAMITAPTPRASVLAGEGQKAGLLWAHALTLAYRYDFDVKILRFKRDASGALLVGAPPQAVFIEHVDKLWDPDLALELDALITYVYEAALPCWIEFISPQPLAVTHFNPEEQTTVRAQFSHRIEQLKQRSPLTYISPSALSKLKEMSA